MQKTEFLNPTPKMAASISMALFRPLATYGLLLLAAVAFTGAAHAQALRTWISAVGDDVNPCSRTAPCKTFRGTISKTASGGEISVLDAGNFGSVSITKSLTLSGVTRAAGVDVSSGNGITINVPGGRVVLRNLALNGQNAGGVGVNVVAATAVLIEDARIDNFITAGIAVAVTGEANVTALRNTTLSHNADGIRVNAGATDINRVFIEDSLIFDTQQVALKADGAKSDIVLSRSFVSGSLGRDIEATNGATVTSYGNNRLRGAGNPTGLLTRN